MKERVPLHERYTLISTWGDVAICWNKESRTFDVLTRDWIYDEPGGRADIAIFRPSCGATLMTSRSPVFGPLLLA